MVCAVAVAVIVADPKVADADAVSPSVADVLPAGMVILPAGLSDTPWGRPVRLTVIGALVAPFHTTMICMPIDDPVRTVTVDGLKDSVKSAAGGVGLAPAPVPTLPPPQPAVS